MIFKVDNFVLPGYVDSFFVQIKSKTQADALLEESSQSGFSITTEPNLLDV